ncbi:zinc-ribbon domain-containing protein [Peptoniphilus sp.]|uniref:zinc-ribbon domain-containing protein n=1 Tax=Peptoniphilus sp. TaxID=1971214 RepID=UPI003995049B
MFCPNCGNKVDPNDNYCKICGKNLKNVKVKIVSENNNQIDTNSDSKDKTIVFKPIKNIDSIENTKELKEIIKQVDETVKSNIENYTKASEKTLAEEKRLREEIDKKLKASEEEKKKSEKVEKESKEKKDSKIKKDSEPKKDAEPKKKSKSFKEKFRDFINEEDEFSIFEKSPNPQDINMTLTNMDPVNIEDTMSIPKAEIEARLKEAEKTEEKEEKDLSKSKEPAKVESKVEAKDEKKKSKQESLDKKDVKDKENKKDLKESTKTTTDEKSKDVDSKHISSKDFYDEVNRALKENPDAYLEEEKEKKSIFSFFKSKKSDKKDKIDSKEKEKKPKDEKPANKSDTLENIDDKAKGFLFKLEKRLDFNDKGLRNGVVGIVYLLNVLAVMLAVRKLSIAIFVLPLLRILLTLAEHYYPLDIATNKVSFITDQDEVNQKSFVNWALCQVLVFILYIINPIGGMFNFTILESITPGIVTTIILFLVTTFIATSLYKDRIEEDKIDFIGWYLVPFILFEMLMKILFLLVDFLTRSFLI